MKEAKIIEYEGKRWITCPYCNKRLIEIHDDTDIKKLPYKCKRSDCKMMMLVNVEAIKR